MDKMLVEITELTEQKATCRVKCGNDWAEFDNFRAKIKNKYSGHCAYCGCVLGDRWHIDHMAPILRTNGKATLPERDSYENMMPACIQCNNFKNVFSLEQFRNELSQQVERGRKRSVNFRMAEKYGHITVNQSPIVFWFERCWLSNHTTKEEPIDV